MQRKIAFMGTPNFCLPILKNIYQNGYEIRKAVMVDMFPHTPHIETVVLFSK